MPPSREDILADEPTGQTCLPLARVKKTIAADEDIQAISGQSTFLISKATELFVRYLTDKSFTAGKAENKNKKTLQYKDVASTVARIDNLEFLSDLVPQTTTWKAHKAKKQRDAGGADRALGMDLPPADQSTLDARRPVSNPAEISILSDGAGPAPPSTNGSPHKNDPNLEFRHYDPVTTNGTSHSKNANSDVDME